MYKRDKYKEASKLILKVLLLRTKNANKFNCTRCVYVCAKI